MEWYVYIENVGRREIERYNIFNHVNFGNDVKLAFKNSKGNKESFLESLKRSLMYYFWSRCEYEIILSDWPPSDKFHKEKIDVYDQIMLNWNVFSEYVWSCMNTNAKKSK